MKIVFSKDFGHLDSDEQTVTDIEQAISCKLPQVFSFGDRGIMAVAELRNGLDGETIYYIRPAVEGDDYCDDE